MKLPGSDRAFVDDAKLRDYCLSVTHPRGRHKARVFANALGLTVAESELLRKALLEAARAEDATTTDHDEFGQRYVVDFDMKTAVGEARVRSSWIVRDGEDFPRLTSC